MLTLGKEHPLDAIDEFQKYSLAGVAQRIKGDVLLLAGTEDHFVPFEQVKLNARRVNVRSLGYQENLRPGVRGCGALSNGSTHSVARRSVRLVIGEIRESALNRAFGGSVLTSAEA
jgi:hypothetical protein